MKGIELSERFYIEYGEPMLNREFKSALDFIAVGIAGSGSERFGYDDELSRDHDFEAGFYIFLPSEELLDRRTEFELERAYSHLPREYMGVKRSMLSAVGGNRYGVIRISDFFTEKTGKPDANLTLNDWLFTPEQALLEATNGKIFFDGLGLISEIRQRLSYLPEDVRLKKLAGELVIMGQAGQYNYPRCISRGDKAAAQLAIFEFVKSAMHAVFLLNKKYLPYYKWSFKALCELERLSELYSALSHLISSDNQESDVILKREEIEYISNSVIDELRRQKISDFCDSELEGHAYSVNSKISDGEIRNRHILCAV